MAHLVTGYAGSAHITAEDQGAFNAAFFGKGQFVMDMGSKFAATIVSNNTVRIADGDLLMQGRHIRVSNGNYEDMTITTGTAGKNRIDLILVEYKKVASTGIESATIKVKKGTAVSGEPSVPTVTTGDIFSGATTNQMPLYAVRIEGINIVSVTQMFEVCPTYQALAEQAAASFSAQVRAYMQSLQIENELINIKEHPEIINQLCGTPAVKQLLDTLQHFADATSYEINDINHKLGTQVIYTLNGSELVITTKPYVPYPPA